MFCDQCNRYFATKYTYKRHLLQKHGVTSPNTDETGYDSDDSKSTDSNNSMATSQARPDIFEDNESDTSDTEENEDFWTLLIHDTVLSIHNGRAAVGLPGPLPNIQRAGQLVEGKHLTNFINRLKENFHKIKQIYDASVNDTLLDLIQKQADKIQDKFEDSNEEVEDQAVDMAWKKYKFLIKKKIANNIDELEPLVGDPEENENSDSEQMTESD